MTYAYQPRAAVRLVPVLGLFVAGCATPHLETPGEHGPHCAAIQAATGVSFSSDRAKALCRVAGFSDLTAHEQIYLVDATVSSGGFSGDITRVLVTLASNAALAPSARDHIARRQRDANLFSSDAKLVADALASGARY